MVVLEMVHEVSAVSFHLLIARHRAEHNLGETLTEKACTFKLFPFSQYGSNQFCPVLFNNQILFLKTDPAKAVQIWFKRKIKKKS
jgi:hypothetical protein